MHAAKAAVLLASLLFLQGRAAADENYALLLGRTVPLVDGGLGLATGPGIGVGLEYIHQFSWVIGAGLQADWLPFKSKSVKYADRTISTSAKVSTLTGVIKISPFYGSKWEPFFLGGMGVNSFFENQYAKPNAGFLWPDTQTDEKRTTIKTSSTDLGYLFGGGIEGAIGENGLYGGLEARWHYFNISEDQFGKRLAKAFTIMARISVRIDD